ncbi:dGTPase [Aeromonas hydrophila]|uniref:dGTPase n=1 Tax=Aeromonas hydrophila TaxID=644 RepID=UPI0004D768E0|nr:dGTPase [Aeromonas hydrophila]EJN6956862.1 dGTPase [Aeromonas hydrophila]KER65257.1 deoxyguanosinetriphosphate triphosphohydrolase [Aeromonas hydrophila]MCX4041487.1 dGTPase [Aeromonas hydrophila]OCA66548.1 deoxyguanosinetriphosphate triphosphohydrolase [Aeromonas hydrophila]OCY04324.1 deoxyguanosinetriphosphate triphosphohydrolase [Aeromonas hydrophila]
MENLIKIDRSRVSTADHSSILAATQSDRARLIYSAPFRRLQQKAQVFSLESNSAVRSRLTHSIEVSHIGRYIVAKITEMISQASHISTPQKEYWKENGLAISNIVEIACLMHDIGNPPFGHFGEAAIVEWARSDGMNNVIANAIPAADYDKDKLLSDFYNFDGNPQGFRIITKLQGDDGFNGLNLTFSQLTSFLKYTHSPETKSSLPAKPFTKKIGFFETERHIINKAWQALSMPSHSRHPLGFLMEASDDISYCISDIEDGIEKGIITLDHFIANMKLLTEQELQHIPAENKYKTLLINLTQQQGIESPIGVFLSFKTQLQNILVHDVAEFFISKYNEFLDFSLDKEIIFKGTIPHSVLKLLKTYTGKHLFSSCEAEEMELSGFSIIYGILEEYQKLLSLQKESFIYLVVGDAEEINERNLKLHHRLFNRLPSRHVKAYMSALLNEELPPKKMENEAALNERIKTAAMSMNAGQEWNLRAHLIVDFVSGMTDQFSMEFFQMLKGINVK